jgi:hypothetical protein
VGGKASNSGGAMVRQQEQQAAEARTKDTDRQNRIAQGLARIRMAFEGSPVMGSRQVTGGYDFGRGGAGLPPGYQFVAANAGTPDSYKGGYVNKVGGDHGRYYSSTANKIAGTPGSAAYIRGPDGKIYRQGDTVTYDEQYDTGQNSGGFGEDFFNRFRQGMLDTYMPQVEKQYGEAKDDLTYGLARAGTGRSSAAVDATADLAEENRINRANIVTKADQGAGALRSRVADERAKAESQLYATENPDVGANQALAAVKNISLATPDTTPLGDVFKTALVGGANALTGYRGEKLKQEYGLSSPRSGTKVTG